MIRFNNYDRCEEQGSKEQAIISRVDLEKVNGRADKQGFSIRQHQLEHKCEHN